MKHPLNSPLGRMGVETLEDSPQRCAASIPVGRLLNPLTGIPTLATTAMLVDQVGGLLNHRRHGPDEWAVSSALSLELTPDAAALIAAAPDVPVLATGRPFGTKNASAQGLCELTVGDEVVATGSVRSFYITAPGDPDTEWAAAVGPTDGEPPESLAERMAIRVAESDGASVLVQTPHPAVNNSMSIVHGGLAATALELVASAAVNKGRADMPLNTASLRVNYLRPFRAGPKSRYVGTALRVGRGSGVGEAQAIGDDGVVALIARLTAYRAR
jgi:uncharacterized protein (TIGR00369 family)